MVAVTATPLATSSPQLGVTTTMSRFNQSTSDEMPVEETGQEEVRLATPGANWRATINSFFARSWSNKTLRASDIAILVQQSGVTPPNNGSLCVEASNDEVRFKYKGSDGIVRIGKIALS